MTFAGHEMDCLELKAELLCFLTLSEIFAFHSNGAWLRTDHLVESTRIWLRRRNHHADWTVRLELSLIAAGLARQLVETGEITHGQRETASFETNLFFTDDMQINLASPVVIAIYARCVDALAHRH